MDKETKQLLMWFGTWILMMWLCSLAGGTIGLILFAAGTALMLMYAWADYKLEQARKSERKKVIEGAERIEKAYQAQEEKNNVQM